MDKENLLGIGRALKQTAVYPDVSNNLMYPTLGLSDEIAEFILEGNSEKEYAELGDVIWYLNQVAYELSELYDLRYGWQFKMLDNYNEPLEKNELALFLFTQAGKIAGIAKKIERDGIESALVDWKMGKAMAAIQFSFVAVACYIDAENPRTALAVAMTRLLNKLTKRAKNNRLHGDGSDR
jgi:NTP pyrophosphatase (non-canonical NTP hydrolase)